MPVAHLEVVERQDPLSEQLVAVVVDAEPEHGQLGQHHLPVHNREVILYCSELVQS